MKTKQIEIHIKTHERIVFRQISPQEIETVCAGCQIETVFLAPERAAFLFSLTTREIYRRIERGIVHSLETDSGATLVCSASLSSINSGDLKQLDSSLNGENL